MDLDDIQLNLNALRKLYGLLRQDEDGFQTASSLHLDNKARLLLKKLLDDATERVFEAYSKIIAAQWGTQLGPPRDTFKLESLVSADDVSTTSPSSVAQNPHNHPTFHKIAVEKVEQEPSELPTQAGLTEQLKSRIAASEPEKKQKRCRVCHRITVKKLNSAKDLNSEEKTQDVSLQHQQTNCSSHNLRVSALVKGFESEKIGVDCASNLENQRQKRNRKVQHYLIGMGSSHLSSIPTTEQEPLETNPIPKELTDAIKQIELCIPSSQQTADCAVPPDKKNAQHAGKTMANSVPGTDSVTPIIQKKKRFVTGSALRQAAEFVMGSNDSSSEAVEFVVGTNDLLKQRVSRRSFREAKGSSLVQQMPSRTVSQLKATKLPNKTNSQTSKPLPPSNYLLSQLVNEKVGRSKAIASTDDTASEVGKPIGGHKMLSPCQNVNTMVEKVKSLSRTTSQNNHMPSQTRKFVQRFRVSPTQNEIANGAPLLPPKIPGQIEKETQNVNRIPQLSHRSMLYESVGSTDFMRFNGKSDSVDVGQTIGHPQKRGLIRRKNVWPHNTVMRPSLLDQKPGQIMVPPSLSKDRIDQEQSGAKHLNRMGQWKKNFTQKQELQVSSASYSSTRTSQLASTSSDEIEGSSLPGKSRTRYYMTPTSSSDDNRRSTLPGKLRSRHYMTPTSSSESKVYRLPDRSWGSPVDSIGSSEIGEYSLPSKARYHGVPTGGGESDSYPPSDGTTASHRTDFSSQLVSSTSRRIGPSKNNKASNSAIPERRNGRLRKLKDKLAIIFHHHHHHHHHHHNQDRDKVGAKSLWKYAGKIFHHGGKDEARGKQMVEKLGKSMVHHAPAKNQRGHFHMLAQGLLRHACRSKNLKSSTGAVGRLAKGQHGSKKVANKLNWWQMLRHHKGVKLPNRPRVKLGHGSKSKKPKL